MCLRPGCPWELLRSNAGPPRQPAVPVVSGTVEDVQLMFDVLNPGVQAAARAPLALKDYPLIASEDLGFAPLDEDVKQAFRRVVDQLKGTGATVIDDNPGLPSSVVTWAVTASFDAASNANKKEFNMEDLGEVAAGFIQFGGEFNEDLYLRAEFLR